VSEDGERGNDADHDLGGLAHQHQEVVVEGAVADVDDPVGGDVEDGGDVLFCSGGSSLRGLFFSG
jgi:hypothetical protein